MKAVTNAGPLIHLSWIGHLDLLHSLFDEVLVPFAVRDEVLLAEPDVPGLGVLREAFATDWLLPHKVADPAAVVRLRTTLDRGESEAIALIRETEADLLLLDDRHARAVARSQGLPITGTIEILCLARERMLIPAALPLLAELRQRGFRIGVDIVERIRREEMAQ